MRIYIASRLKNEDTNRNLFHSLCEIGVESFLPESIGISPTSAEEKYFVAETCYKQIEECEVIIGIYYYGISVGAEIGAAIDMKRKGFPKTILMLCQNCNDMKKITSEAMVDPYIDGYFISIDDILKYIKTSLT